jgi:hypothetical protein
VSTDGGTVFSTLYDETTALDGPSSVTPQIVGATGDVAVTLPIPPFTNGIVVHLHGAVIDGGGNVTLTNFLTRTVQ